MYFNNFDQFINEEKERQSHFLSGIVLILDNKVLLVNAKKFKGVNNKWSIPKGHTEGMSQLQTAISELGEEANIHLSPLQFRNANKYQLSYSKGYKDKFLTYYVVHITRQDLDIKLYNDMILKYFLNKDEIAEAGFFSKNDAMDLIEYQQRPILNHLK